MHRDAIMILGPYKGMLLDQCAKHGKQNGSRTLKPLLLLVLLCHNVAFSLVTHVTQSVNSFLNQARTAQNTQTLVVGLYMNNRLFTR